MCCVLFAMAISPESIQAQTIHIEDVRNFWSAYDHIVRTTSFDKKLEIINAEYLLIGSDGLKKFAKMMNYTDSSYVRAITQYPKFWKSLRRKTDALESENKKIAQYLAKLKTIYPDLKPAQLYLCMGLGNSGGKPIGSDLVIGRELALGDSSINTTEYKSQDKQDYYASRASSDLQFVAVHEYIHTQQKPFINNSVLKQAIREGSCDFIAELVIETPLDFDYIRYGYSNAKTVKQAFRKELLSPIMDNWFYNSKVETVKDLGYFVGYDICKKYYFNSKDKAKAIKDIIEIDYADDEEVFAFLNFSGYFQEELNQKTEQSVFDNLLCP